MLTQQHCGKHTETRSWAGVMTRSPLKACDLTEVNTLSDRVITCTRGPPRTRQPSKQKVWRECIKKKMHQAKCSKTHKKQPCFFARFTFWYYHRFTTKRVLVNLCFLPQIKPKINAYYNLTLVYFSKGMTFPVMTLAKSSETQHLMEHL